MDKIATPVPLPLPNKWLIPHCVFICIYICICFGLASGYVFKLVFGPVCSCPPPLPLYLTDPALHGLRESLGLIYTPMMSDEDDDNEDNDDDVDGHEYDGDDVDLEGDDGDVGADHGDVASTIR